MCRVYNIVGSLSAISKHLKKHKISEFRTVDELIFFSKNYTNEREQLIIKHEVLIESEKDRLKVQLSNLNIIIIESKESLITNFNEVINNLERELDALISGTKTGIFVRFSNFIRKWYLKSVLINKRKNFDNIIDKGLQQLQWEQQINADRLRFIESNYKMAVQESSYLPLKELDRKKRVIDEITTSIYGAIGEQKVVDALQCLPEEFILINDFTVSFLTPLYWPQGKERIKSVQIDHVLVCPGGVFLLETKNWSKDSLYNLSLRSPVLQIRRASYALHKLLSSAVSKQQIRLNSHHWGDKKIPIRNLIVMVNSSPAEEFQYVKVLPVKQVPGYVRYFKPVFSSDETESIANYLLNLLQS